MDERDEPVLCLIDSNIFLRTFVRDDEQKWKDSMQVFQAIAQRKIKAYIPTLVAAEVNFVLTSFYKFEKSRVIEATKSLASLSNLKVIEDLSVGRATQLYEQHAIKFTDCLLASSALLQTKQATILSYDRDFDKLGVRRLEPRALLTP